MECFVISNNFGPVGVFNDKAILIESVVKKYEDVKFLIQSFQLDEESGDDIYMTINTNGHVAYASNNYDKVLKIRDAYLSIGCVFDDDPKKYTCLINTTIEPAIKRLETCKKKNASDKEKDIKILEKMLVDMKNFLETSVIPGEEELEKISFLREVVEVSTLDVEDSTLDVEDSTLDVEDSTLDVEDSTLDVVN
jgi:hypothetical protein